jgi:hypothetical protein
VALSQLEITWPLQSEMVEIHLPHSGKVWAIHPGGQVCLHLAEKSVSELPTDDLVVLVGAVKDLFPRWASFASC